MKIVVLGAGVQGTLYGVRLAGAGHEVTFVARARRAAELRSRGAILEHAVTGRRSHLQLPVVETLPAGASADLCFVAVRREQLAAALVQVAAAGALKRVVFFVNHANGSEALVRALGRARVVLGFPGAAGGLANGVVRYVDIAQQPTALQAAAGDVAAVLRRAGFRVALVADMDSWLRRHAVFVTAVSGALYEAGGEARRLALQPERVRSFLLALRDGWAALDKLGVAAPPLALRTICCWVPLPLAVIYWRRLFGSQLGELYFARHARHAPQEMAALAGDIRALLDVVPPRLERMFAAIDGAARCAREPSRQRSPLAALPLPGDETHRKQSRVRSVAAVATAGIAAATAASAFGKFRWERATSRAVAQLMASTVRPTVRRSDVRLAALSPEVSAALPAPVRRYFEFALTPGQPLIYHARLHQNGMLRSAAGTPWVPFTAVQHFCTDPIGFVWAASTCVARVFPMRIRDSYLDAEGASQALLAGLVPIGIRPGTPEVAAAALVRYLAEATWFPTALLPSDKLVWTDVDDRAARVTLSDGSSRVWLDVSFGPSGEIESVRTERSRAVRGRTILTPWVGHFREYARVDGMMIPLAAEVAWIPPEGALPVWRGRIVSADYTFRP